ncbi:hypothetical protein [Streptomyces sp. NPDC017448]|uniref:hypothetical protein n=1 Tax=Streptomyces sp. NPDC017448 TaxID=3364996 RepID=UPI0037BBF336
MSTPPPAPEEFRSRPDTYSGILPMHVDGEVYKDGVLVHSAVRAPAERTPEDEPGWTVQSR